MASYFLHDQIGKEINHINEDKLDNRVENLEYITQLIKRIVIMVQGIVEWLLN